MRIALIIEHFDPTRGGAEHFTHWLAVELAKGGHEVHVVCHDVSAKVNKYRQATQRASHDADRSHQAHPGEEILPAGVHIHRLRGMKLSSGMGFRRFGKRAEAAVKKLRPELVHSMTVAYAGDVYQPHAGVYAEIQKQAVASRATGAAAGWKKIFLAMSAKQRTLLALERRALAAGAEMPRAVVSLCPMMTEQIRGNYGTDAGKIVELANPRMKEGADISIEKEAADREWFREHYQLSLGDKVAVFVGHDFRRKGLRYAIEAVGKTIGWKLLVVGLGKAREYVDLANGLGIGDIGPKDGVVRVLFVGPTRDMDRVYAAADALILPTFYDSFGLVVLEAFAHGLPAVSTKFLGAGYLIERARAGAVVDSPRDVEAMAAALEALPGRGTREQLEMAGRAREASRAMLPGEYLERMVEVYRKVARKD